MSIFEDMCKMHTAYNIYGAVDNMDKSTLEKFLEFRAKCVMEEAKELEDAIHDGNAEEVVDALIDVIVFAAGTLDLFDVDGQKAWDEVLKANMNKKAGIKEGRPNPFGLPDLVKPMGWKAPSHEDNHGIIFGDNDV